MMETKAKVLQALQKTQQAIDKLASIELTSDIESADVMIQLRVVYNSMVEHKATLQTVYDSM